MVPSIDTGILVLVLSIHQILAKSYIVLCCFKLILGLFFSNSHAGYATSMTTDGVIWFHGSDLQLLILLEALWAQSSGEEGSTSSNFPLAKNSGRHSGHPLKGWMAYHIQGSNPLLKGEKSLSITDSLL